MPPLQRILALLSLLSATTTTALPGAPKSHKNRRPGQPWAACEIEGKSPRDAYRLEGSNWNVTETQLKAAINGPSEDGLVLTAWEWKVWVVSDEGVERFEAKVRYTRGVPCGSF